MRNPFSLEGKTILITGASSGIGRATAIECSRMGAIVAITGRNAERLNDTFLQLEGEGHMQIIADLSKEADAAELIATLPELNGAVHCAGFVKTLPIQFINTESLTSVMDVNFMAPTLISAQLVKKKKLVKGSSIVFISSIDGPLISNIGNSIYAASKGAVGAMSKAMALELAPKKIRVNCIQPGMIETEILSNGFISAEQLEEEKKRYPLKRFGKPEEVAHSAIYLLSDGSSWVTGSNLLIDGGFTLQ